MQYCQQLKDPKLLADLRQMLILCDKEFVPPLSSRDSTTQMELSPVEAEDRVPEAYFKEISAQPAIIATKAGRLIAIMSFKHDYICEHISSDYAPNLYVTTVIVHPAHRHHGIAGRLYEKLLRQYPRHYVLTRTWSTNLSHIRILLSIGFHEHCCLRDDRGPGVDTVYYRFAPKKGTLSQYIDQYHLGSNIFFSVLLVLFTTVFLISWLFTDGGVFHELSLAIATSLMASLLCLLSDTFLKIRESKNDTYISKLKSFGIENLQFNKNEILESIIPNCRSEIWISGCRLIMTSKASFRQALVTACKRSRKMRIRLLAAPPWSSAYQLIYGDEPVSLNYIKVLKDLLECTQQYGLHLEVHFSQKPLFSDTYKVDDRFITGPYLNCADRYNNRITAKDFFSLDITDPGKDLYQIIYDDYMALWNEAAEKLDLNKFAVAIAAVENPAAISEQERIDLLRSCCEAIPVACMPQ